MENLRPIKLNQEKSKEEILKPSGDDQIKWLYNYIKTYPEHESAKIITLLIEDAKNGYSVEF